MSDRPKLWLEDDPIARAAFTTLAERVHAQERGAVVANDGIASSRRFKPVSRRTQSKTREELDVLLDQVVNAFAWQLKPGVSDREIEARDLVATFKARSPLYSQWDSLTEGMRDRIFLLFEKTITDRTVRVNKHQGFQIAELFPKRKILEELVSELNKRQQLESNGGFFSTRDTSRGYTQPTQHGLPRPPRRSVASPNSRSLRHGQSDARIVPAPATPVCPPIDHVVQTVPRPFGTLPTGNFF